MKGPHVLLLIITLLCFGLQSYGQNTAVREPELADPSRYLLDSLVLSDFSDDHRQLLDSCLDLYHVAKDDTSQLVILEAIAENLLDQSWHRYNQLLRETVESRLMKALPPDLEKRYLLFLEGALNNEGYWYHFVGNIRLSLEFYHKSLKIGEQIGDTLGIACKPRILCQVLAS